jgi:hypothetical protein
VDDVRTARQPTSTRGKSSFHRAINDGSSPWQTVVGALLLSEPLGCNTVAGGLVVIAGVLLGPALKAAPGPAPGRAA